MFRKFQGAEMMCDICEESESFRVSLNRNITEQDMIFDQKLKDLGWGEMGGFDLCPKHYLEYQKADDKEEWRGKHDIL